MIHKSCADPGPPLYSSFTESAHKSFDWCGVACPRSESLRSQTNARSFAYFTDFGYLSVANGDPRVIQYKKRESLLWPPSINRVSQSNFKAHILLCSLVTTADATYVSALFPLALRRRSDGSTANFITFFGTGCRLTRSSRPVRGNSAINKWRTVKSWYFH